MGDIVRLPKHSRASREQAERLRQLALELELSPEARGELDNALYRITETPGRRWVFVMISPEQFRFVTKAVRRCRNVATTLSVWTTAITYMRMDTGEITASREQLASEAETTVQEVSRAMGELTKIGAIIRQRRGRRTVYFVNPTVGWNGGEGSRLEAARGPRPSYGWSTETPALPPSDRHDGCRAAGSPEIAEIPPPRCHTNVSPPLSRRPGTSF